MEFISNPRGCDYVALDGFIYSKDKTNKNGSIAYRCMSRSCNSRAVLCSEAFTVKSFHDHLPDQFKIDMLKKRLTLKKIVKEQPTKPIKRLYTETFCDVPDCDQYSTMPAFKAMRTSLYNERAKTIPKLPTTVEDITLDGDWVKSKAGSDFLLIDSKTEKGDRILAFGTIANLRFLCENETYFMDGTFYVAPSLFEQVFIIHAFKYDNMFPLVYALLPDKTTETYLHFFELLKYKAKQYDLNLDPKVIQIDYEKAIHNAANAAFKLDRLRGCLFHYTQCIWRAVQRLELMNRYKDEEDIAGKVIRRSFGLPFLPLNDIDDLWTEVIGMVDMGDHKLYEFLDYVTSTFVDDLGAIHPREIWTQADQISNTRRLSTNNHLESFHGKIKKNVTKHPNIYKFIQLIKNEQDYFEMIIRQIRSGLDVNYNQPRKYRLASEKLARLRNLYENNDISAYEFTGKSAAVTMGQKK